MKFLRFSYKYNTLGFFFGTTNYSKGKGIEIFTNNFSFSVIKTFKLQKWYSGSLVEPYTTTVRQVGCFVISYKTPKKTILILQEKNRKFCEEIPDDIEINMY